MIKHKVVCKTKNFSASLF